PHGRRPGPRVAHRVARRHVPHHHRGRSRHRVRDGRRRPGALEPGRDGRHRDARGERGPLPGRRRTRPAHRTRTSHHYAEVRILVSATVSFTLALPITPPHP